MENTHSGEKIMENTSVLALLECLFAVDQRSFAVS